MNLFKKVLTNWLPFMYILNMFNTLSNSRKSAATQAHILSTALAILRRRGLDDTTMRDIAKEARVALGAAYYYFPSKEAIVQQYYDSVGNEHAQRVQQAFASGKMDLDARLRTVFHSKLEILHQDRKLLGALFRYTGEPAHPLCAFGPATSHNRLKSMALFQAALTGEKLPEDLRESVPLALWGMQMLLLLYFIYDDSAQQQRTHKLIDSSIALFVRLLSLIQFPLLKPFRGAIVTLLRDAGLFPESTSPAPISLQEEPS
jgi:AcrR family transcriptional regulator